MTAALVLAFLLLVYFGRRRSDTLDVMSGIGDERAKLLYTRAVAFSGTVMSFVLPIWWLVTVAQGDPNEVLTWCCAIFGATFILAVGRARAAQLKAGAKARFTCRLSSGRTAASHAVPRSHPMPQLRRARHAVRRGLRTVRRGARPQALAAAALPRAAADGRPRGAPPLATRPMLGR